MRKEPLCQLCGGHHLSITCQVGNPLEELSIEELSKQHNLYWSNTSFEDLSIEELSKGYNSYSYTYNDGRRGYDNSNFPQFQERTSLDEAMERVQETFANFCAKDASYSQDIKASSRNMEKSLELIDWSIQENMEISSNEQVEEYDSKRFEEHEEEFIGSEIHQGPLILDNPKEVEAYDDGYPSEEVFQGVVSSPREIFYFPSVFLHEELEDQQEDTSRNQINQILVKAEEKKIMDALPEGDTPKEVKTQLLEPNIEFSRAQDVYISSQQVIKVDCTSKEEEQSMFEPQEVGIAAAKKVQLTLLIQIETYILQGVKSFQGTLVIDCLPLLYPKLGKYYRDDTIYIYDPGG